MPDELPASIKSKLPAPTENAGEIAKLVTGVTAAVAGIWFPPAAIAAAVLPIVIDRYVNRPREILLKELQHGNVNNLSAEQLAPFVPMAYKFFEAAKEGEYEHNLKILAAYLTGEMKQEIADPANFSRMARRIEGLSTIDLQVMALIDAILQSPDIKVPNKEKPHSEGSFISASFLPQKRRGLTIRAIEESLADLASRGFLLTDAAMRAGKTEEYYYPTNNLRHLVERAREHITSVFDGA